MIIKVFHLFINNIFQIKLKSFTVDNFEKFTSVFDGISEEYFFLLKFDLVDLGSG